MPTAVRRILAFLVPCAGLVFVALMVAEYYLVGQFARSYPEHMDAVRGYIYPLQLHGGRVYVGREQHQLLELLAATRSVVLFLGGILGFLLPMGSASRGSNGDPSDGR
ncbi:hypothetical protein SAMN05421819_2939 [Bryocella elongata]|uniref:Uncharacterized protein n=1 Tax=Bryocella elongata TaxID=863522 RepID=A0A1H6A579_9BACT|nr:hypothetical protein [Bryocella elongata]SEG43883.1 hypothetical protein SAMN05421819_2939 [Bryocella elongata]